ncbi:MAG TPA: hypothetical protein VGB77_22730 [Abditibacteriaceae bacterium]|jgi:hypothetical protein
MAIEQWMSWEGGVDLIALTPENAAGQMPNIIVHVARMVHTPVGSAPAGMILWQPDPNAPPQIAGFVSPDPQVGAYFGPHIFAGTPFENGPVLEGSIEISFSETEGARARVTVGDMVFESHLSDIGPLELIHRGLGESGNMMPFAQQGLEGNAQSATLKINGENVPLILPPATLSGAPAAAWAPSGLYAR